MNNRDYPVVVYPLSEEDGGGFAAIAPDLPGCMGDGASADAALLDLYSAIEEWTDESERLGRPVPAPGAYVARRAEEQKKIIGIIKSQAELLQKQSKLIDQGLAEVRAEVVELKREVATVLALQSLSDQKAPLLIEGVRSSGVFVRSQLMTQH